MESVIIFAASKLHTVIVLAGVVFFLCLSKERKILFGYRTFFALPAAFILGRIASLLVSSPRPFVTEHIQPLIAHVADNGFPSEHTLLVATVAALVYTEHKAYGIVLGALAICVGVSRVLADVHHGIDVVGSVVIAAFTVFAVYHFVVWVQHTYADHVPFLSYKE